MLSTAETRPKRLRDARAAMYTELILEAATIVFAREGYEATKVQQVAKEASISLGTLYEVFPGKFEIWRAIHERHLGALFQATLTEMGRAGASNLLDHLLVGLEAYLGYLLSHPDYLRLHLLDGSAWALGTGLRSNEQLEAWERGKGLMTALLARGVEEGMLVDEDPELLAQIMIGMHQVRLAHWVKRGMKASPSEVVTRIQAHTIRAFFVPSLVKKALARLEKRKSMRDSASRTSKGAARPLPRARRRS
ncbi:MAG TPA: TetR/AcrR family transcriptional regulator [Polyangiaceae bacterium]|jgi:AcrR family transcriptional regulator|nr:TetR/AcrR family transcriptional regulator [Polyangiaceae bacterium]